MGDIHSCLVKIKTYLLYKSVIIVSVVLRNFSFSFFLSFTVEKQKETITLLLARLRRSIARLCTVFSQYLSYNLRELLPLYR